MCKYSVPGQQKIAEKLSNSHDKNLVNPMKVTMIPSFDGMQQISWYIHVQRKYTHARTLTRPESEIRNLKCKDKCPDIA
jgi:hypothetical protein